MGISYGAKRVKEAAQLWEPMAKYIIARKTAADAAAVVERDKLIEVEQWGAERRTEALKVALDHHAEALNTMNKGVFEGAVNLDETNLGIYTEAFNRWRKTQLDYYSSVGMNPEEYGGDTISHLKPFFNSIFEGWAKEHPDGDPAALKWGKENGVWGDVILRGNLDPKIHRDDAQIVWDSLYKQRFGDGKKGELGGRDFWEWPWEGGQGLIGGIAAQGAGLIPDLLATGSNLFLSEEDRVDPANVLWGGREKLSQLSKGATIGDIAGQIKDKLSGEPVRDLPPVWPSAVAPVETDKQTITPSGKYTPTGPFAASGLISGATDYMRGPFASEAPSSQDIETLEETVKSLEEVESDAKKREVSGESIVGGGVVGQSRDRGQDISQEAASFLAKLLEYMTAYGPEEARVILSEEFSQLSNKAKNELQSYLMTESEALA